LSRIGIFARKASLRLYFVKSSIFIFTKGRMNVVAIDSTLRLSTLVIERRENMLERLGFTTNNISMVNSLAASQFQNSSGATQVGNPFFRPDSVSIGNVASPFQTYSAAQFASTVQRPNFGRCWQAAIRSASENTAQMPVIDKSRIQQAHADRTSGNYLYSAFAMMGGGTITANILWSDNSTPDNPEVIVRGVNADGSDFEVKVNINEVDPRNATKIELFALRGYFKANGIDFTFRTPLVNIEGDAFSTRFDFTTALSGQMESNRNNSEIYELLKSMVGALLDHIARIEQITGTELFDNIARGN
jgi:hypothetical protein